MEDILHPTDCSILLKSTLSESYVDDKDGRKNQHIFPADPWFVPTTFFNIVARPFNGINGSVIPISVLLLLADVNRCHCQRVN